MLNAPELTAEEEQKARADHPWLFGEPENGSGGGGGGE